MAQSTKGVHNSAQTRVNDGTRMAARTRARSARRPYEYGERATWQAKTDLGGRGERGRGGRGRGERGGGCERARADVSERGCGGARKPEVAERRIVGGRREGREKQEGGRRKEEERNTTRCAADSASSARNAHGPARSREHPRGARRHRIERTATSFS
ncbi:hypothetical protein DENSPDRAFT_913129 [Dentipellis sp. KUC8613]|nr:hypothetical protein DENSPDRAFT_913129 [Dentipellis sp. KUC8613]